MENSNKRQKMSFVCPSCNEEHFEGHRCLSCPPELESLAAPSSEAQLLPPSSEPVTSNVVPEPASRTVFDHASMSLSGSVSCRNGQEVLCPSCAAGLLRLPNASEPVINQASRPTDVENRVERSQATFEVRAPTETRRRVHFRHEESSLVIAFGPRRVGMSEDNYPMTEEQIETVPTISVTREVMDKMDQCPICLEHFEIDEEVKKLICDHIFHAQCIKPWLIVNNFCPVCRCFQTHFAREYTRSVNMELRSIMSGLIAAYGQPNDVHLYRDSIEQFSNYLTENFGPPSITRHTSQVASDDQSTSTEETESSDDETPTTK